MYLIWAVILHYYSGLNDIVFGTAVSGRNANIVGIEHMVGLFTNTLPLRVFINPEGSILELLDAIRHNIVECSEYENTRPLLINRQCENRYICGLLFDSIVVVENYAIDLKAMFSDDILNVSTFHFEELVNYPLALAWLPIDHSLTFQYDASLFSQHEILSISDDFLCIMKFLLMRGDCSVEDMVREINFRKYLNPSEMKGKI